MNVYDILINEYNNKARNGLYSYVQILFSYNSNRIEGSKLSMEQTHYIYETNSFLSTKDESVKVDDIIETINHFKAFDFILKNTNETLDKNYIKDIHKILKQGVMKEQIIGDFKTKQNYIGDFKTTSPLKVENELDSLLNGYDPKEIRDIIDFHYKFESIHPFEDGNGRVGRLIMFKECLKNNITPFIIDEEHKLFYYRGLKQYLQNKGYLIDTCLSCQDKFNEILKEYNQNSINNKLQNLKSLGDDFNDIFTKDKSEDNKKTKRSKQ